MLAPVALEPGQVNLAPLLCCAACLQDLSVQHRQANMAHARSVLLGQSGSAAAAAAAAAAMAAAASVRLDHT